MKIIPFAVDGIGLKRAVQSIPRALEVKPYLPLQLGVVSTLLPALKASAVAKTMAVLAGRLESARAVVARELRTPHEAQPLAAAIRNLARMDLVVVFGASAATDRRDVLPAAVELAGEYRGASRNAGRSRQSPPACLCGSAWGSSAADWAPGCARSPKENGFDLVLRRLLAGVSLTSADLRRLGVGGLLSEIWTQPQRQPR